MASHPLELLWRWWPLSLISALPGAWFTVVLVFCFVTVWAAYGIRALLSWQAALALALFFLGVAASNAWQFVPMPGEIEDPIARAEAWRLWVVYAKEARHIAVLGMWALAFGFAFILCFDYPNRAPMLTKLIVFVLFMSQTGEAVEVLACKISDPALGFEHKWYAADIRKPSCGRAFGNLGPLIFPALTAAPLPLILLTAWRKKRERDKALTA